MTTETYIATAYRWGETNGHRYLVAAGPDRDLVIQAATAEAHDRSGKYGVEVVSLTLTGEQERVAYLPSRCDEPAPRHNHRVDLDEVERLRLVVATLDEIRDEVLHGGPVTRTPNEVLDLIDRATAHLEDTHG